MQINPPSFEYHPDERGENAKGKGISDEVPEAGLGSLCPSRLWGVGFLWGWGVQWGSWGRVGGGWKQLKKCSPHILDFRNAYYVSSTVSVTFHGVYHLLL